MTATPLACILAGSRGFRPGCVPIVSEPLREVESA
jgi:hypothetical protein